MIVGIDEAGRGPVIGPLVICALGIENEGVMSFVKKDSKKMTPKMREAYAQKIETLGKVGLIEIWPEEIDSLRETLTLNEIEVQKMACAAAMLGRAERIYVDACDTDEERFSRNLGAFFAYEVEIVSRHRADAMFPIVAAASIVAKVRRDALVAELRRQAGRDFGSGYPSDKKTVRFLEEWISEHRSYPDFVRKSWKTVRR